MIILNDMLLDLVAEMIVFVDKNMYTKTLDAKTTANSFDKIIYDMAKTLQGVEEIRPGFFDASMSKTIDRVAATANEIMLARIKRNKKW